MSYIKRENTIEAWHITEENLAAEKPEWLQRAMKSFNVKLSKVYENEKYKYKYIFVHTKCYDDEAPLGYWIVRDDDFDYEVVSNANFLEQYCPAPEDAAASSSEKEISEKLRNIDKTLDIIAGSIDGLAYILRHIHEQWEDSHKPN